ncbi:uncharacterized protein LOC114364878 [Ostrinia furnacalis]|uniref:uncharacterized protein LOC114364878 n=1 Tax=Ostrinia furnacalis TaxID=93504 RepID=UPI00103B65EF|nr:uncharacterized protein LOC114364878 [Ostrinia furnacalis]
MKVVVTGAAGFLGSRLADLLLSNNSPLPVKELILVDNFAPTKNDPRVRNIKIDLSEPGAADKLISPDVDVFFHLAAIVSGHAEVDFDLGFRVNFDATSSLLEAARAKAPKMKFVFTSTCGVFGGKLPPVLDDLTALMPENTYGITKAMCELMINDYSRKGFVDGRVVRLPTVSVRAGVANKAVTSFASGIVREPLNGVESVCPVPSSLKLWLTGPEKVVRNIVHAAIVPASGLGSWRVVNLPGITVTVAEMLDALKTVAGESVASLVRFEEDKMISGMVATFPAKFDNSRALKLGFEVDSNYADIIRAYIRNDLKKKI